MKKDFLGRCKVAWSNAKMWCSNHTGIVAAVGAGMIVGGTVLACKATLKVDEKTKKRLVTIKEKKAHAELTGDKKPLIKEYAKCGLDWVREYAPSVALVGAGIGIMNGARCIEKHQKEGILAAYLALQKAYDEKTKALEDANPNAITEEKKVEDAVVPMNGVIFEFDDNSTQYTSNPDENALILTAAISALNVKLVRLQPVYLNELMRALGHAELKNGWEWFWYKTPDFQKIDFGLSDDNLNYDFRRGLTPKANLRLAGLHHISEGAALGVFCKRPEDTNLK